MVRTNLIYNEGPIHLIVIIILLIFIEYLPEAKYTVLGNTKLIIINNSTDSALNFFPVY